MSGATILTRRELYDLVWSKPMATLAGEFGLSDVGLAKICERHRVPHPPRGYWAKLAAGKPVRKAHFKEISEHALNRITIQPGSSHLPPAIREVVERTRAEQKALKASREPSPPAQVAVLDLAEIHKSVRASARALRKAKPEAGIVRAFGEGLCGIQVGKRSVERTITLLHELAVRLAAKDLPLEPTGHGMQVQRGQETVAFVLKEKTRREKHVLTADELEAEERRQARFRRSLADRAYLMTMGRTYPEWDTVYTGALVIEVAGYDNGLRKTWADGKTQTLETLLDSIVDGIELLLAARKVDREQREERARKSEELARRRALAQKRREREAKRLAHLEMLMARTSEARQLAMWLAEMEAACSSPEGRLADMLSWARTRLAALESSLTPAAIAADTVVASLFPEDDDLHDPLGDPPSPGLFSY